MVDFGSVERCAAGFRVRATEAFWQLVVPGVGAGPARAFSPDASALVVWLVQELAAQGPVGLLPPGFDPLCGNRSKLKGGCPQALLVGCWPRPDYRGRWQLEWYLEQHCKQHAAGCKVGLLVCGYWRHREAGSWLYCRYASVLDPSKSKPPMQFVDAVRVCSHRQHFSKRRLTGISRAAVERTYIEGGCSAKPQQLVHSQLAASVQRCRPDMAISEEQAEMLIKQAAVFRHAARQGDSEWQLLEKAAAALPLAAKDDGHDGSAYFNRGAAAYLQGMDRGFYFQIHCFLACAMLHRAGVYVAYCRA